MVAVLRRATPRLTPARVLAVILVGSAVFLSLNVLRLSAELRAYLPVPPQAKPETTSFVGADPEGIWVGTAKAGGHSLVQHTPYGSIGSVADTRNRIVIFDRKGAVLADVSAHSQDPVLMNFIRKRVQESR
jgi:hypothetical protein